MNWNRRRFICASALSITSILSLRGFAGELDSTVSVDPGVPATSSGQGIAASDMLLASEWIARSYEITARVPQEMLCAGHRYSDVLIAMGLMAKGASLNELMEQRKYYRWAEVARRVEVDPQTLAAPLRELLPYSLQAANTDGRVAVGGAPTPSDSEPDPQSVVQQVPVLHFLPDVYSGQAHDLSLNAFTPVIPTASQVKRFRLDDSEVSNIRKALDDPLGVPEALLLETAGRGGLKVGDWVLAGVLTHHKPLSIDNILAARSGEQLSWSETCLAFSLRPDVLTRGPLAGIYPIMSGTAINTVLVARRKPDLPASMASIYDLARLSSGEVKAMVPLMERCYRVTASEQKLLGQSRAGLAERGILVALARLSRVDLGTTLDLRRSGRSYTDIVRHFKLDMTGELAVSSSILSREHPAGEPS
jgi:hypothetical protein